MTREEERTDNGQLLRTLNRQNKVLYSIDVSTFARGTYIINVIDGENSQQRTFVKK